MELSFLKLLSKKFPFYFVISFICLIFAVGLIRFRAMRSVFVVKIIAFAVYSK